MPVVFSWNLYSPKANDDSLCLLTYLNIWMFKIISYIWSLILTPQYFAFHIYAFLPLHAKNLYQVLKHRMGTK